MATSILTTPNHGFENECKEIHESWERPSHLIKSLACKSSLERQQIRETYKAMYGEDITSVLQNMGASRIGEALCLWMVGADERDALMARQALQQVDTNFKALIEIFVGRKSSHIMLFKQAYYGRFRRHLDQDIACLEPPHPYQKILVALATSHKAHQVDVSQHIAKCDAKRLYEAGEGSSGVAEEAVVLEILSKRSIPQMKLTFSCYKRIYGHEFTKSLKKGNTRGFEAALKTVIKCMCNPTHYYAKELYGSIKGSTTDKGAVGRVMISRAETDMNEIQRVFKKKYGKEVRVAICESIQCGDSRDFLVALATKTSSSIDISS